MIKRPILASVGSSTASRAFKIRPPQSPDKFGSAANLRACNRLPEEGTNQRSLSDRENKRMAPCTGHKLRTSLMASAISGSVTCGSSALICISIASRRVSSTARALDDCSGCRNIVARRSSSISTTNRLSELLSLTKASSLGSCGAQNSRRQVASVKIKRTGSWRTSSRRYRVSRTCLS